jgi:antitoxin component of MazEF toxin-antitoxin module
MKATIDRIEEGIAVLISSEGEPVRMTIPSSLLPHGAKEGDSVTISVDYDEEATAATRQRVTGLLDKLKKKQ